MIYSGNGLGDYGNVVIVKHTGRYTSVYAHNDRNLVRKGSFVEKGEKIAVVGATGKRHRSAPPLRNPNSPARHGPASVPSLNPQLERPVTPSESIDLRELIRDVPNFPKPGILFPGHHPAARRPNRAPAVGRGTRRAIPRRWDRRCSASSREDSSWVRRWRWRSVPGW